MVIASKQISSIQIDGKVLSGPLDLGGQGRVALIQDSFGAVAALFQPAQV
jgi:predicted enzyme related to lactoylglutathione lyase